MRTPCEDNSNSHEFQNLHRAITRQPNLLWILHAAPGDKCKTFFSEALPLDFVTYALPVKIILTRMNFKICTALLQDSQTYYSVMKVSSNS